MNCQYCYMLYRYSASHIEQNKKLQEAGEQLFNIQQLYLNDKTRNITFNPIHFFATNIKNIITHDSVKLNFSYNKRIPDSIISDELILFTNNHMNNLHITQFFVRYYLDFPNNFRNIFDPNVYYSQNFEIIDKKYELSKLSINDKAALFYVEYGFWKNIHIKIINPWQFIASYPEYNNLKDDVEILAKYFEILSNNNICFKFDPYVYVASNINDFESVINDFNSFEFSDDIRIAKHYIKNGYPKKKEIDSFNMYDYLANNPKYLREILKDENGNTDWNVLNLTKRKVAIHFILNYKKSKSNSFNAIQFVQNNINDNSINIDKKLSIENASKYFTESYIKLKQVRYHESFRYKLGMFCSERVHDSLRTLPLSVSKCFVHIPLF